MSKAAELAALIGSQTAQSNRNLVINGAMRVAQRGTSSTGLGATTGYFTVDRMKLNFNGTAGRLTSSQSAVTDLDGFSSALKLDCTTADTSIAASEFFGFQYRLEGQDIQVLDRATSSAKPITVSFYAKGTAKTYMSELEFNDGRVNQQQFTVSSSWQRFSLTYVGDTGGSAPTNDNSSQLSLFFWLHGGSNFTSGTFTSNTWAATTNANRMVGIGSFFSSTDNELFITGLQIEIGEVATPFEHRTFADDLTACMRYYEKQNADENQYIGVGYNESTSNGRGLVIFKARKRAAPTVTDSGTHFAAQSTGTTGNAADVTFDAASPDCVRWILTNSNSTLVDGGASLLVSKADDSFIQADAEL
jgi:hypothetical protein